MIREGALQSGGVPAGNWGEGPVLLGGAYRRRGIGILGRDAVASRHCPCAAAQP